MTNSPRTFRNPIVAQGADPWVIFKDGYYWYCFSDGKRSIFIARSEHLEAIGEAKALCVWQGPADSPYSAETWAPELHQLDGRWYIYFAASDGRSATKNHRLYVLESLSQHPLGPYRFKGPISASSDRWAIDGTVLDLGHERRYFIWSGWDNVENTQQNLYIAKMKSPWALAQQPEAVQHFDLTRAKVYPPTSKKKLPDSFQLTVGAASLKFELELEKDDFYCLEVHYAHGHALPASLLLTVGDELGVSVLLPPAGLKNWQSAQKRIFLNKGKHEISLKAALLDASIRGITLSPYGADRILISSPTQIWEKKGGPPFINEGPQILRADPRSVSGLAPASLSSLHLIYSASGSWTDDYTLARLSLEGSDPLDAEAWRKVGPVFSRTKEVFGPGHASFTRSLDGTEHWIVYHSAQEQGSGWRRQVNLQRFHWNERYEPEFGQPEAPGQIHVAPGASRAKRSWREGA